MIARNVFAMATADRGFPAYTATERTADLVVHLIGLPAAITSVAWLVATVWPASSPEQAAAALVYGAGLIGMVAASAAYHLAPPGPAKARLRRLDHAMIFVMIAGTYTPFLLNALAPGLGVPLCVLVWALAATHFVSRAGGVVRSFLVLYLTQEQQLSPATAQRCGSNYFTRWGKHRMRKPQR